MKKRIREFTPYNPDGLGFPTGFTLNILDSGYPPSRAGDYNEGTSCGCTQDQSSTSVDQAIPEPNSATWMGLAVYPDFQNNGLQKQEGWNGYIDLNQTNISNNRENPNQFDSIMASSVPSDPDRYNETRKRDNKFIKNTDPIADTEPMKPMTLDLPELLDHTGAEYHYGDKKERPHMVIDPEEESELVDDIHDDEELTIEEAVHVIPFGRYKYHGHEGDEDVCKKLDGSVWQMDDPRRPIIPAENAGVVNTHPHCKCTWEYFTKVDTSKKPSKKIATPMSKRGRPLSDETVKGQSVRHLRKVNRIINKKLKSGTLHQIDNDGKVLDKKFGEGLRRIVETVHGVREEASWLTDDYLSKVKAVAPDGAWLIIRASEETITDHRGEGEQYPRLLAGDELHGMARTAVGHGMDINHYGEKYRTDSVIADSEYNPQNRTIEMLVHEGDPEIIQGIADGLIQAVSINGGAPRHEEIADCDHPAGKCMIPRGVILGELDDIALTYVVTATQGFMWKGELIPPASPGVSTTAIDIL